MKRTFKHQLTFSIPWIFTSRETVVLLTWLFHVSLATFVLMYVWETLAPGFVTGYYAMTTFFWLTIGFGLAATIGPRVLRDARSREQVGRHDYIWIVASAVAVAFTVWKKNSDLGWSALFIGMFAGAAVFACSWIFHRDGENLHDEKKT